MVDFPVLSFFERLPSQDTNTITDSFYGTELGLPLFLLFSSRSDRLAPYCFFTFLAGTHNYLAGIHNYFFTFRTETTVHHGVPLGGWYCTISFFFLSVLPNRGKGPHGSSPPRFLFRRAWQPLCWLCGKFLGGLRFVWYFAFPSVWMNVPWVFLTLPACFWFDSFRLSS